MVKIGGGLYAESPQIALRFLVGGFWGGCIIWAVIFHWSRDMLFLNSNLIVALATVLTGGVAIGLYLQQRHEVRVQAARLILQEVRGAEEAIDLLAQKLEAGLSFGEELTGVMPVNSWRTYSHLFARFFDSHQLKAISSFYNQCEVIQAMVIKQNNFFWVTSEERAKVIQQKLADLTLAGDADSIEKLKKEYASYDYSYVPVKVTSVMKFNISQLTKLSVTSIGDRFTKLAGL